MVNLPSTAGVEVAAYDLGGSGPPLLMAHATGFHGRVFQPLAARLSAHFHCYSFDERFHGETVVPPGVVHDWQGLADDALAVADGLGLERPFGVGHSAGGAALLTAEDRSGRFRALYCFEPIVPPVPGPAGPTDNPLSAGARRRREVFPSREDALANYSGKAPFDALDPEALRAYVDHGFEDLPDGTVRLRCRREDEAELYRMSFSLGAFDRLPQVACPVTVACGERTDIFGPDIIERQAAALPRARTEVLPGLGHFGPLEDPAAVAAAVVRAFAGG